MPTRNPESRSPSEVGAARQPLPHRLRLLFVGPGEPPWALLALRLESAGCAQAEFDWQTDISTALTRLRKVTFDCMIARDVSDVREQPPAEIRFAQALRASGSDEPIVVIQSQPDDERTEQLEDLDCELLVSRAGWQSRALVPIIRRAVNGSVIRREIAGHKVTARRGRLREREEAESQLHQLRSVLTRLRGVSDSRPTKADRTGRPDVVARIEEFYRQLLRTYVMMGSGSLSSELARLAELLSLAGLSPVEAMAMHLTQIESLLQGLGNRSSRHVMARGDLLALELMTHLGELYRQKSQFRGLGDAGVDLMHAESLLQRRSDADGHNCDFA